MWPTFPLHKVLVVYIQPLLRKNSAENFNRLSRVHERYRQTTDDRQTDGRTMTYSERELTSAVVLPNVIEIGTHVGLIT